MNDPLVARDVAAAAPFRPTALHRRRLRDVWRSAGWPCRDAVELDLLAGGWLVRRFDAAGRETLELSDAGLALLAETRRRHQAAFAAHEALVQQVAQALQRDGRIVWRGLTLRAPLAQPDGRTRWALAMPDVYSIRNTSVEDYVDAAAHEIKVSRADLLADLRRADKSRAYLALSGQCWYVLKRGIADVDEVPPEFGVAYADGATIDVARPAPRRALRLPFTTWIALARASADGACDDGQSLLGGGAGRDE